MWNTGKWKDAERNIDIFREHREHRERLHSFVDSWPARLTRRRIDSEIVNHDAKECTVGETGRPIIIHGKCVVNLAAHGGPNSELGRPRSARDKLDRVGIRFLKLLAGNYARRVRYR